MGGAAHLQMANTARIPVPIYGEEARVAPRTGRERVHRKHSPSIVEDSSGLAQVDRPRPSQVLSCSHPGARMIRRVPPTRGVSGRR